MFAYMFSFDDLPFHGLDVGLHPLGAVLELIHVLIPARLVLKSLAKSLKNLKSLTQSRSLDLNS